MGNISLRSKKNLTQPEDQTESASMINPQDDFIDVDPDQESDLQVVFSFDTTGSVYPCLNEVRKNLAHHVSSLLDHLPNIRIGIISMADYTNDKSKNVIEFLDFSNDPQEISQWIDQVQITDGEGGSAKAYELALRTAVEKFEWSARKRALVIIGDSCPHPPSYTDLDIWWRDELVKLISKDVKVYAVQVNDHPTSTPFYKTLADHSTGVRLCVRNAELMTDVFRAVCYNELGPEALDGFRSEVESREGFLDADREDVFARLKKGPVLIPDDFRTLAHPWWSRVTDTGNRCFEFDRESNKFLSVSPPRPKRLLQDPVEVERTSKKTRVTLVPPSGIYRESCCEWKSDDRDGCEDGEDGEDEEDEESGYESSSDESCSDESEKEEEKKVVGAKEMEVDEVSSVEGLVREQNTILEGLRNELQLVNKKFDELFLRKEEERQDYRIPITSWTPSPPSPDQFLSNIDKLRQLTQTFNTNKLE
eukprot:TRINITY_DN4314_c0_g1_i1.p1 TRINITY_DN4314_c0_g1~~TRINITY_DN4314_c0_g1_i1.p1  ORF type:complete len:522 (-),score=141.43 TRINITY_DN4314_c0_g1_i1:1196-2629(-)